ncbi:MAG: hypothetical protein D6698_00070 [Gammaproteobacteria bacterium]|nr:MAG: hypothetical protein D6698_00070 [Gammaproteobacteria bacterium]
MNVLKKTVFLLVLSCIFLATETSFAGEVWGFVGLDSTTPGMFLDVELIDRKTGEVVDEDSTNVFGKYSFKDVEPGKYLIRVGEIQRKVFVKSGEKRLDIDLSDPKGRMDYSKAGRNTKSGKRAAHGSGNNVELARQIAGLWWGYSGSTERSIGLCSDGSYFDSTESSYSGRDFDSLGNETMAWGSASQSGGQGSWTIQGDGNSGTIYIQYRNGTSASVNYRQIGDPGCLSFDGNTLCRKSASCR